MTPGVLETTRPVVEAARDVAVDRERLAELCARWAEDPWEVPPWDEEVHYPDPNYVLLLDALNFCFWADPGQPRWELAYRGRTYNGYRALAAGLRKAVEEGVPLLDAAYLRNVSLGDVLAGIPLLEQREANAREVGRVLCELYEGSFETMARAAGGSAVRLVQMLEDQLSSFRDRTTYAGHEVRFLKRAQITVVDLAGTFSGEGCARFEDLRSLTAFADYKIPQVLEAQGILRYSPALAAVVDRQELIPPGDPREVEIRAGMVWAVEWIRQELSSRGRDLAAYEIDWFLWNVGQQPVANERPYHRTRTIFY